MNTMISRVRQFLTSEDGPTAVEYAILCGLIAAALVTAVGGLTSSLSTTFNAVAGEITTAGTPTGS
jgi:pilus assembly protein Flp/PilA